MSLSCPSWMGLFVPGRNASASVPNRRAVEAAEAKSSLRSLRPRAFRATSGRRTSVGTIAVMSPDYLESRFAADEWSAAFAGDTLLPVRVRPFKDKLLGVRVYIDLVDQDAAAARAALLEGVKQGRRKPASAPSFPGNKRAQPPQFPGSLPELWRVLHRQGRAAKGALPFLAQRAARRGDAGDCGLGRGGENDPGGRVLLPSCRRVRLRLVGSGRAERDARGGSGAAGRAAGRGGKE